jgi:hypothetical protein
MPRLAVESARVATYGEVKNRSGETSQTRRFTHSPAG